MRKKPNKQEKLINIFLPANYNQPLPTIIFFLLSGQKNWQTYSCYICFADNKLLFLVFNVQKIKFPIKDFFSKCDQIRRKLWIWSDLLKKSLMGNFIFCAVLLNMRNSHPEVFCKSCSWKFLESPLNNSNYSISLCITGY